MPRKFKKEKFTEVKSGFPENIRHSNCPAANESNVNNNAGMSRIPTINDVNNINNHLGALSTTTTTKNLHRIQNSSSLEQTCQENENKRTVASIETNDDDEEETSLDELYEQRQKLLLELGLGLDGGDVITTEASPVIGALLETETTTTTARPTNDDVINVSARDDVISAINNDVISSADNDVTKLNDDVTTCARNRRKRSRDDSKNVLRESAAATLLDSDWSKLNNAAESVPSKTRPTNDDVIFESAHDDVISTTNKDVTTLNYDVTRARNSRKRSRDSKIVVRENRPTLLDSDWLKLLNDDPVPCKRPFVVVDDVTAVNATPPNDDVMTENDDVITENDKNSKNFNEMDKNINNENQQNLVKDDQPNVKEGEKVNDSNHQRHQVNPEENVDEDDEDFDSEEEDDDLFDEEVYKLLDEDLKQNSKPDSKMISEKLKQQFKGCAQPPYIRHKTVLKYRNTEHFEVLPDGWIEVTHTSGIPVYLHKASRSCTLARPYFLGPGSVRRHNIPLSAVPCLYQKHMRQMDEARKDEQAKLECQQATSNDNGNKNADQILAKLKMPHMKLQTVEDFKNRNLSGPQLHEYCKNRFEFATVQVLRFKSWSDHRAYHRKTKRDAVLKAQLQKLQAACRSKIFASGSTSDPSLIENEIRKYNEIKKRLQLDANDDDETSPTGSKEICINEKSSAPAGVKPNFTPNNNFRRPWFRGRGGRGGYRGGIGRPTLPSNVKLITVPDMEKSTKPQQKQFFLNPQGKTSIAVLHEYVQKVLKGQVAYEFSETRNAANPYMATVKIISLERQRNGFKQGSDEDLWVSVGTGSGNSKKNAKIDAARDALKILVPGIDFDEDGLAVGGPQTGDVQSVASLHQALASTGGATNSKINNTTNLKTGGTGDSSSTLSKNNNDVTDLFDMVSVTDSRVYELSVKAGQPSPFVILQECLKRHSAFGNTAIEMRIDRIRHHQHEFHMKVGRHDVKVRCTNKKEGKQKAAQFMLEKLQPQIKTWGSLIRLYGYVAQQKLQESRKQKDSIIKLQSQNNNSNKNLDQPKNVNNNDESASSLTNCQQQTGNGNSSSNIEPNHAILTKLRQEMSKIFEKSKEPPTACSSMDSILTGTVKTIDI